MRFESQTAPPRLTFGLSVSVAERIGLEKLTDTLESSGTAVAPLDGLLEIISGGASEIGKIPLHAPSSVPAASARTVKALIVAREARSGRVGCVFDPNKILGFTICIR